MLMKAVNSQMILEQLDRYLVNLAIYRMFHIKYFVSVSVTMKELCADSMPIKAVFTKTKINNKLKVNLLQNSQFPIQHIYFREFSSCQVLILNKTSPLHVF